MLPDREGDIPSLSGDCRAAENLCSLTAPQLRASSVGELPDTLACPRGGNVQEIIGTQPWREPCTGSQRNSRSRRQFGGRIPERHAPKGCLHTCDSGNQAATV